MSDASPVHTQGGSRRTPGRRAEAEPGWKWSRVRIEGEKKPNLEKGGVHRRARQEAQVYLHIQEGGEIVGVRSVRGDHLHHSGCGQGLVQQLQVLKCSFSERKAPIALFLYFFMMCQSHFEQPQQVPAGHAFVVCWRQDGLAVILEDRPTPLDVGQRLRSVIGLLEK